MSTADLLDAVRQLNPSELERFVSEVLQFRAQQVAPNLSQPEAELLQRINRGLPKETRDLFRQLVAKRRDGTLTAEEHAELLRLTEEVECGDAQRIEAMAELARLRQKPVRTLMEDLGLRTPPYEWRTSFGRPAPAGGRTGAGVL